MGGGTGRTFAERNAWSFEEDARIVASVREHGCKWRLIASFFEGRSDDAVRNRWNRVKDLPIHNPDQPSASSEPCAEPSTSSSPAAIPPLAAPSELGDESGGRQETEKAEGRPPDRVSWSRREDEMILLSVATHGHRWHKIAKSLPGRTEHAIRNRYARLQSLANRGKPIPVMTGRAAVGQPIGIQLVPPAPVQSCQVEQIVYSHS